MFEYVIERIDTPALAIGYHLAPWDEPAFDGRTAVIAELALRRPEGAAKAFAPFRTWCDANAIMLVNCRLPHDQLAAAGFLESQGFRFIELNYRPTRRGLEQYLPDPAIRIALADAADEGKIADMAAKIFADSRLHADPEIDSRIGDRRYRGWASNAFRHSAQQVMKCVMEGQIVGFMVVEAPAPAERFWSLVGLAPGLAGQGLGRRVWQTMLAHHHAEKVTEVSTSISSHNSAVHNLYVGLGFRFPAPTMTFHWCPRGPITMAAHA